MSRGRRKPKWCENLQPARASGFESRSSQANPPTLRADGSRAPADRITPTRRASSPSAYGLAHEPCAVIAMKASPEVFADAVRRNRSIAAVLRALGLRAAGSNYKMVHRRVRDLALDTSHWTGKAHLRGRTHEWAKRADLAIVLRRDSEYRGATSALKKRLLLEGLLSPYCSTCTLQTWMEQPLVLHLDHINGDPTDNRLQNLRLLCPNCHSQTLTYCGRNRGRARLMRAVSG